MFNRETYEATDFLMVYKFTKRDDFEAFNQIITTLKNSDSKARLEKIKNEVYAYENVHSSKVIAWNFANY